jgi:hypothetical protein
MYENAAEKQREYRRKKALAKREIDADTWRSVQRIHEWLQMLARQGNPHAQKVVAKWQYDTALKLMVYLDESILSCIAMRDEQRLDDADGASVELK